MYSFSISFLVTCLLAGALGAKKGGPGHSWGYDGDIGPDHWKDTYPECGKSKQSPIDIVTNDLVKDGKLNRIAFTGYETKIEAAKVTNNGHTVVLEDDDTVASISGGGLPGTYKFKQLHFHWGKENNRGSEHKIDGDDYPLEMHVVHFNKRYGTIEEAVKKEDGLAVLGILFELTDDDNEELVPLIEALDEVTKEDAHTILKDTFDIDQLIPDDTLPYYRYSGSLTTPGCQESVIWTVFKHKQHISAKQLAQFRTLREKGDGDADSDLEDNFRPTQPLNGRKVKVSIDTGNEDDPDEDDDKKGGGGAGQVMPSILLILTIFAGAIHRIF